MRNSRRTCFLQLLLQQFYLLQERVALDAHRLELLNRAGVTFASAQPTSLSSLPREPSASFQSALICVSTGSAGLRDNSLPPRRFVNLSLTRWVAGTAVAAVSSVGAWLAVEFIVAAFVLGIVLRGLFLHVALKHSSALYARVQKATMVPVLHIYIYICVYIPCLATHLQTPAAIAARILTVIRTPQYI
mmetsp:Transcript_2776/g.7636  ORF Transcript_2776/g.7636 Transcript_2776/m.7636 type:complete len:189 (+) Transcript_2776:535-1101(+)